jgi:hypothetical protein
MKKPNIRNFLEYLKLDNKVKGKNKTANAAWSCKAMPATKPRINNLYFVGFDIAER